MSGIQDRYRTAARHVMTRAGGDPEVLAAWGQEVHQAGDVDARAILAQDGTILAQARLSRGRVHTVYITRDHATEALGIARE